MYSMSPLALGDVVVNTERRELDRSGLKRVELNPVAVLVRRDGGRILDGADTLR